jgi:hypothetical protein
VKEALTANEMKAARSCPVRLVFLAAGRDRLMGRRGARAIRQACKRAAVVTIPAPHLVLQCAPRAAVAAMNELGLFDG